MAKTLQRQQVTATAAEQAVSRLDSYSADQHAQKIADARARSDAKGRDRQERARRAAARLRTAS